MKTKGTVITNRIGRDRFPFLYDARDVGKRKIALGVSSLSFQITSDDKSVFIYFLAIGNSSFENCLLTFFFNVYLWERVQMGEGQREIGGQRIQTGVCPDSSKPYAGLELMNSEIMTWAEVGRSEDWATRGALTNHILYPFLAWVVSLHCFFLISMYEGKTFFFF